VNLSGAAHFVRGVGQLNRTTLGFEPSNLISIDIEPSFGDASRWDQFFDALLAETKADRRSHPRANLEAVTPGYFRALGTRLVAGRDFTRGDRADTPGVVIVSVSAARRYWPDREAIGELILLPTQRMPGTLDVPRWQTVVGVVEDIRYRRN
jgi:hypothetical protein